jgi:hypothetical protein
VKAPSSAARTRSRGPGKRTADLIAKELRRSSSSRADPGGEAPRALRTTSALTRSASAQN